MLKPILATLATLGLVYASRDTSGPKPDDSGPAPPPNDSGRLARGVRVRVGVEAWTSAMRAPPVALAGVPLNAAHALVEVVEPKPASRTFSGNLIGYWDPAGALVMLPVPIFAPIVPLDAVESIEVGSGGQGRPSEERAPLPVNAGPLAPPPSDLPLVASPSTTLVRLTPSRAYRGRLELPPGSRLDLKRFAEQILTNLGLERETIQVFATPAEAAPHVASFALANPGRGTRWFHARYLGGTLVDVPRPRELVAMWTVARSPER